MGFQTFTEIKDNKTSLSFSILKFNFTLTLLLSILSFSKVNGQPPVPCTTGFENTCKCHTSPILCSIEELNGYSYSMTHYLHPNDGPNGCNRMCPPPSPANTTSHNPTWFRFPAWCTNLTLQVCWSNCTQNPGQCTFRGIQSAVYSECFGDCADCFGPSWNCNSQNPPPYSYAVGCEVGSCGANSGCATYTMNNLTFGKVYYFLVDGCCGSACDVVINVLSPCGVPEIQPYESPISGPTNICPGETAIFTSGVAPGANTYIWTINGVQITQTRQVPITFQHQFTAPGEYEVCISAYNQPCIPPSQNNPQQCFTITVGDANAGTPMATPSPLCPGGTVNLSATDYIADFNQRLVVVNSSGQIVAVYMGDMGTFSFDGCGDFILYSVNYSNSYTPVPNLAIGQQFNVNMCTNGCCDIEGVPFSFGQEGSIEFIDAPPNATYTCIDDVPPMTNLDYTNLCTGGGNSAGVQNTGAYTPCTGGTITRTWTVPVPPGCGSNFVHTQTITIEPIPIATIQNAPDPAVTIPCAALPTLSFPTLSYNNGGAGDCAINGTLTPNVNNNATICNGGTVVATWQFTDQCNRVVTHTQTVTVTPIAPAEFVNPPGNINISCDELASFNPVTLNVTNGDTGACQITGTATPVASGMANVCGGTLTYTWTHTDQCNNVITHTQNVTVTPAEIPQFVDPPSNITIPCDQLDALTVGPLSYTNGDAGACLFTGSVDPVQSGSATICGGTITNTWTHTDQCNNTITHVQNITVTPVAPPQFLNVPNNITLSCTELESFQAQDLSYTNNGVDECLTMGTLPPSVSGTANECGGTLTNLWTFTDVCNNTISHTQTVTVTPLTPATFQNPPADVVLACHQLDGFTPASLSYTNNSTGQCLVSGMVDPTLSGSATICGGTLTYTWTHTDQCNNVITHTQNVTVTPVDPPQFVNPPADVVLDCHLLDGFTPVNLNYTNNGIDECLTEGEATPTPSGSANECGGTLTFTWTHTDQCNNVITHTQNVTVTPIEPPQFVNPPADVVLDCHLLDGFTPVNLNYTNNGIDECLTEGEATPTPSGSANECGGTLTFTWTHTDQCNNVITHTQNVTVTPIAPPQFVNPPADETISCDVLPTSAPDLNYTNNGIDECLTEGSVPGTMVGTPNICGGAFGFQWQFTDQCGNAISHTQNITIQPAEPPQFINPPADETIACDVLPTTAPALNYTNNGAGECLIEGSVPATLVGTPNICGGAYAFQWQFTDECGNNISHTQNITVTPPPPIAFINPPPAVVDVACNEIPVAVPNLDFSNGASGQCLLTGSAPATQSGMANICGGSVSFNWNATDQCGNAISYTQTFVVAPAPVPQFINLPSAALTIPCNSVPPAPPALNYTNGSTVCPITGSVAATTSGSFGTCGGEITYTWQTTTQCGHQLFYQQVITVLPAPEAAFVNPPPTTITISCAEALTPALPLSYTNNNTGQCLISGTVTPTIGNSFNTCGGTINRFWTFTDVCNRTIAHQQIVTVLPATEASFINPPPPNISLACEDIPTSLPELNYGNGLTGVCRIEGTATAIQSGSYNACGGNITYTWNFTDQCNRTITRSQNVTVTPAAAPQFADIPQDVTLGCNATMIDPYPLVYTNNRTGSCEIFGSVLPEIQINGIVTTYTWSFVNQCNNQVISTSQSITRPWTPQIIVSPLQFYVCGDDGIDLSTISVVEINNRPITLTYHNGAPPGTFNQLPDPVQFPTEYSLYYIRGVNEFGCDDFQVIEVFPLPGVYAGEDGGGTVCNNAPPVNLFSYLGGNPDQNGTWVQTGGQPVNIGNPMSVSFLNRPAGNYFFRYEVAGDPLCPIATANIVITVVNRPNIVVDDVECAPDQQTYFIVVRSQNLTVTADKGTITVNGNNTVTIDNIPIDESITITVVHNSTGCSNTLVVDPPNCDCPEVLSPENDGDQQICMGDMIPELTVTPTGSVTVNWYDEPTGGNLLAENTSSYTPDISGPGVYVFYVQAFSTIDPSCTSPNRTEITLVVSDLPAVNPATLQLCDDDNDGFASFNLTNAQNQINSGSGLSFHFYVSQADAENDENRLSSPFTNTIAGGQTIYASVTNSNGCRSITTIALTVNELPDLDLVITGESCPGLNDGQIIGNASGGDGSYQYRLNNAPFGNNNSFGPLAPGTYNISVRDGKTCVRTVPAVIQPGRQLAVTGFTAVCNNNGTSTDDTDDFYTINFTVNHNQNNAGTFTLLVNGMAVGTYTYGTMHSYGPVPAGGAVVNVIFRDDEYNCELSRQTAPLISCSSDCMVTITEFNLTCNDNGTPTNPNDDTYTLFVNATAVNGGTSNTFILLINGDIRGSFPYGVGGTIILNANGLTRELEVRDNEINFCNATETLPNLVPCSDGCLIDIIQLTRLCNNNGTTSDDTDDFYTFTILAQKLNGPSGANTYDVVINGVVIATLPYGVAGNFQYPATGVNETIIIRDSDDNSCTDSTTSGVLRTCSTECVITVPTPSVICDNNGTPADPSDDFYTILFNATAVNGSSDFSYTVSWNGDVLGTFTYGLGGQVIIPATGIIETLVFTDNEDDNCFISIEIGPLNTCSDQCILNAVATDIICDDAGTKDDDTDDTFTFNLTVNGTNVSAQWRIITNNFTGNYGDVYPFGPFLISDGPITYAIRDVDRQQCQTVITINPPPVCSEACDLTIIDLQLSDCDDGGTGNTDTDDTFSISFRVNTDYSLADRYRVVIGANTYGPFDYGSVVNIPGLPATGVVLTVQIIDISTQDICRTTFTVSQEPCSSCNQTVEAAPAEVLSCDVTSVVLSAQASEDGAVYRWTGPNSFNRIGQNVDTDFPGLYTVTATFPDQCTATDTVRVSIDVNVPQVSLGDDLYLTCLIDEVLLDGSMSSQGPDFTYEWTDALGNVISTDIQLRVNTPGIYFLQVINLTNDCRSPRESIVVFEDKDQPVAIIFADPGNILDCVIRTITLSTLNQEDVKVIWQYEDLVVEGATYVINQEGTVSLWVIDTINGCENRAELIISDFQEYPFINIANVDEITCTQNTVVIDATSSQTGPNISYTWYDENGNIIAENVRTLGVNAAGIYTLVLVDADNGCTTEQEIIVNEDIDLPVIALAGSFELPCDQQTGTLSASINIATGIANINWSSQGGSIIGGANTLNPTISGSGIYQITVINTETGCESTATAEVVASGSPSSLYDIGQIECFGDNDGFIQIENISGGEPPYRYFLNGVQSTTPVFSNLTPGTYTVSVLDSRNCAKDTVITILEGDRVEILLPPSLSLIYGEKSIIEAIVNLTPDQIRTIQWTPSTNLSHDDRLITEVTALTPTDYTIRITSVNGCVAEKSIRLSIERNIRVTIPNIIRPGVRFPNDRFTIFANDEIDYVSKMFIYDRWGNLVFSKENFPHSEWTEGWDGKFNGSDVVPGVYVYLIEVVLKDSEEEKRVYTGDITVIR